MHEIKIYGEIISTYAKDNGVKGVSLSDLQAQLAQAGGKDIKVRINSVGGDVEEGFAMYDELRRYATANNAKVHTFAEAVLASIATIVFLAGDEREISRTIEPFIHNAWMETVGDANELQQHAQVLERCNDKIAKHYSEHTDLSYEEARELMNSNSYITNEEAVNMRFATKVEMVVRPAAMMRFNTNLNTDMNKNKQTGIVQAKFAKLLDILSGHKAKLVTTADERTLDFYELEEDEMVEVGASATIDGQPAEGDYVMKTGETYVFVAGQLTEIREASNEDPAALQAEIDNLTEQLEKAVNLLDTQAKAIEAKDKIIATIKAAKSSPAPQAGKTPPAKAEAEKPNRAALAIEKMKTFKTK